MSSNPMPTAPPKRFAIPEGSLTKARVLMALWAALAIPLLAVAVTSLGARHGPRAKLPPTLQLEARIQKATQANLNQLQTSGWVTVGAVSCTPASARLANCVTTISSGTVGGYSYEDRYPSVVKARPHGSFTARYADPKLRRLTGRAGSVISP